MKRFCCLWVIGCLWFPLMGWTAPAPPTPVAPLSPSQQQWLAQHHELRVGLVLQAPFAQYDRRLQKLSGANVELMKALARVLNVELSWRNFPDLAQLEAAELNLKRTRVLAAVDGYVTNLNVHRGDYARIGEAKMAVVDMNSFWVYGFFEETKLPHVKVGDKADMQLMSGEVLKGHVESISRGIYDRDNPESRELIADVNPTFNWVRLAQRVPVRIHIDEVPEGVLLAAGITCTVVVSQGVE